jgi:plasmid stabilization system protein ParE
VPSLKWATQNPWVIEFGSGAYVALYSYDGREVVILAVRHGREDGY